MLALESNSPQNLVKILPFENGWVVSVGGGTYALPLPRAVALAKARAIAKKEGLRAVQICDAEDMIVEEIPVD